MCQPDQAGRRADETRFGAAFRRQLLVGLVGESAPLVRETALPRVAASNPARTQQNPRAEERLAPSCLLPAELAPGQSPARGPRFTASAPRVLSPLDLD